jgi:hypothetical protein
MRRSFKREHVLPVEIDGGFGVDLLACLEQANSEDELRLTERVNLLEGVACLRDTAPRLALEIYTVPMSIVASLAMRT